MMVKKAKAQTKKVVNAKQEDIEKLVNDLNKKFGQNAVTIGCPRDAKGELLVLDRIPTGSLSLDEDLGGGIPVGRFIEISGHESASKSTQCLHIIKKAQEKGFTCALLDVEGTTDDDYMRSIGIDTSVLLYSNPDGLEEATQALVDMQRSGLVQLAVLDSIASLEPITLLEKDMGESARIAMKATLLGSYFGKFTASNNRLTREGKIPFTLIATNQLREKIGAYGDPEYCLHYDTKILFTDGRSIPIGKVVKEKITGKVWSLNTITGNYEEKDIIDWHDNGYIDKDSDYIHIESEGVDSKNGTYGITVTFNHQVLTDEGWVEARYLKVGQNLITRVSNPFNGTLLQFLAGTFVGDCCLVNSNDHTCLLRFQDSVNPEYAKWKASKVNPLIPLKFDSLMYASTTYVSLRDIKTKLQDRNPLFLFEHYSDMGLALWYMDDGHLNKGKYATLSLKRFSMNKEVLDSVMERFQSVGLNCTCNYLKGSFHFPASESDKLFHRICTYVPDCMQYKLPKIFRGLYEDFELHNCLESYSKYSPIKLIRPASKKQLRRKKKYDISVGDNHNYIAGGSQNGVVVHNSPGGKAKEYFSSINIRLRKGDWITEGTGNDKEIVGQVVKYKISKNKTFQRMRTGEFDFYFSDPNSANVPFAYNDNVKEIIMLALKKGVIIRKGAWYYIGDDNKYNGTEQLVSALREDQSLFDRIYDSLKELEKAG